MGDYLLDKTLKKSLFSDVLEMSVENFIEKTFSSYVLNYIAYFQPVDCTLDWDVYMHT